MIDTIHLRLPRYEVEGIDFMKSIPLYLTDVETRKKAETGISYIIGRLGNLQVTANPGEVRICKGSLCKWFLGDNFQTMTRDNLKDSIEKLSDLLHLPIDKAIITRLDIGENFIMNYPIPVYLNHLGEMKKAIRMEIGSNGLIFQKGGEEIVFYDKIAEHRKKDRGRIIPEEYVGKNVLRIEHRDKKRICNVFGMKAPTASMLYDKKNYIMLLERWEKCYNDIDKINTITMDFKKVKGKKMQKEFALLHMIHAYGGEMEYIKRVEEARKRGDLTAKEAYDMKQDVKKAYKNEDFTMSSKEIAELDKKVMDRVKVYIQM